MFEVSHALFDCVGDGSKQIFVEILSWELIAAGAAGYRACINPMGTV